MRAPAASRVSDLTKAHALAALGLDVEYVRGEGSALFARELDAPVWDFVGGYGAAFLGHNHPKLVDALNAFIASHGVVQAQASLRAPAAELCERIAERLHASTGGRFHVLLANTGAEAAELACRHADLYWLRRRGEAQHWCDEEAECDEPLRWSSTAEARLALLGLSDSLGSRDELRRYNERVLATPAVQLALRRSFHGCTARALDLTWNPDGRLGGRAAPSTVRFVDPEEAGDAADLIAQHTTPLLRLRRRHETHELDVLSWTSVSAFVVEPLQGEGGIHPLDRDTVASWQEVCRRHNVPIIADEIQSGMGRTGSFLYAEQIGLVPDYVLLGKGLGGGIAKISAVAFDASRQVPGFGLQYTSTFAEDDLSSRVALRALQLLDEEKVMDRARERGGRLCSALAALMERHSFVIDGVRGCGLMLGLHWRRMEFERSAALRFLQKYGWIGYAIAGYLLRRWNVRVTPTLSHGLTLRLQPAYDIPDAAIDQLVSGLAEVCILLERQDAAALLAPSLGAAVPSAPLRGVRRALMRPVSSGPHVGFIGHFIDAKGVALWDASFRRADERVRQAFLERVRPFAEPLLCHRDQVRSVTGQTTTLSFIGIPVSSQQCHDALCGGGIDEMRALVQRAVDMAAEEGCEAVGLGGYCSILTRNGKSLRSHGMGITTGNGFTVGAALMAVKAMAEAEGVHPREVRAAVVGAGGNIGTVLASLLAEDVAALTLLGRERGVEGLWREAAQIVARLTREGPDARLLESLRQCGVAASPGASAAELEHACRAAHERLGSAAPIIASADLHLCREARMIVTVSNDPSAILMPCHLSSDVAVIVDLAVPGDVHPSVQRERPNARVLRGGVVRTPCNPRWQVGGIPLEPGEMFACMAETALMGLANELGNGSIGALTTERVRHTLRLAHTHGFTGVKLGAATGAAQPRRRMA